MRSKGVKLDYALGRQTWKDGFLKLVPSGKPEGVMAQLNTPLDDTMGCVQRNADVFRAKGQQMGFTQALADGLRWNEQVQSDLES